LTFKDYCSIGAQPSEQDMHRFIRRGAQTTWAHVETIRHTMEVETALKKATLRLTARAKTLRKKKNLQLSSTPPQLTTKGASSGRGGANNKSSPGGGGGGAGEGSGGIVDDDIHVSSPRVGLEDDMMMLHD
jgi:hypothetical protein